MELLILAFFILLNGVFAMSEMAVVSARKARLQQWAGEGRAGAGVALDSSISRGASSAAGAVKG